MATKSYARLKGVLFGQFQEERKQLIQRHWLDTNTDKYYKVIDEIVIPQCKNIASDVPGYPERIEKLLKYTNPLFSDAVNFSAELTYRTVANEAQQTEENITKANLLRAIADLLFTSGGVLDDCSDLSEMRLGKKTWHLICDGGIGAAIYDGAQIGMFPLFILQQNFRNDLGYLKMTEVVTMSYIKMVIGQTLDVIQHGKNNLSAEMCRHIHHYKAGQYFTPAPILALLYAGIFDEEILEKTTEIFSIVGHLMQTWDDFNDYYSSSDKTGKPCCDLINGGTTWASVTAMKHFTPSQAKEFKDCYGSSDLGKLGKVRQLYDEIDLPKLYVDHMIKKYNEIKHIAQKIPNEKVREANMNYVEWLVGPGPSYSD